MSMHEQPLNERLSALMDGELPASELDALLQELAGQEAGANDWHLYHVAGDVLRSEALAPQPADLAFWGRLEQKLAKEVPVRLPSQAPVAAPVRVAANGPWRWVAGTSFSVLLGLVAVGLWWSAAPGASSSSSQWAAAPAAPQVVATGEGPAVMLRDPELDALMAAHQQMGGHSAWQMPSGFLRNATFERPAR